ncbi:MAG: DUF4198 domain-containing protein [Acidobacteria bacterium]|nr:DUF4198 domain-containing protein [Acidobacteriota bacterium]MBI3423496.1 DUF4198 domain-containing protein [Acidobacteriota bacterium]
MFLKFNSYYLAPNAQVEVRLLNGEFHHSANPIERDRMRDVSLVSPSGVTHPPLENWRDAGTETVLRFATKEPGTYVIGTSIKPKELNMKAADFNRYLQTEGVLDTYLQRQKNGQLNEDSNERYSKHVKALFQVGDARTATFQQALGYPVEIIPQQNPYSLKVGAILTVRCVKDGQPLANQSVLYGWQARSGPAPTLKIRTDAQGLAQIKLQAVGVWYIKFIHMSRVSEGAVNYESRWATLTFLLGTKGQ